MNEIKMVNFDKSKLKRLKRIYQSAITQKQEVFYLDGDEYLVSYAKHLIEYLEKRIK